MGKKAEIATSIQMVTLNITGICAILPFTPLRVLWGILAGVNAVSGAITAFYAAKTYPASEKAKDKLNKAIHELQTSLNDAMKSKQVAAHTSAYNACIKVHTALQEIRNTVNSDDFREVAAEKDIPRKLAALNKAYKEAMKGLPKK